MYFTKRFINVTFDASAAKLGVKRYTGHRVTASIKLSGDPAIGTCQVSIFGIPQDDMNALSLYGQPITEQRKIKLIVEAGDAINGISTVFIGDVQQAWADYQGMPQVPFFAMAYSAGVPGVQRSEGGKQDWNSWSGATSVSTILGKIASLGGLVPELTGVGGYMLNNPYLFGSPLRQAQAVRQAADFQMVVENGVLAAWPLGQPRPGGNLIVSRDTGMVTDPGFTQYGVLVKCEFTRYVKYGTNFTIQCDVTPANGPWMVAESDYDLQAETPKGHWFVSLYGVKPGVNAPFRPFF